MRFRFVSAENNGVMSTIGNKPVPIKGYVKHCDQRRKFPVLYKVEFQVNIYQALNHLSVEALTRPAASLPPNLLTFLSTSLAKYIHVLFPLMLKQ